MEPSIGRIVHYHSYGTPGGEHLPAPRAAIVTQVHTNYGDDVAVSLAVLNPTGLFFDRHVPFSAEPKPGHWTWAPASRSSSVIHASAEAATGGAMCGDREDNYRCRRVVGHSGSHDNGGGVTWSSD